MKILINFYNFRILYLCSSLKKNFYTKKFNFLYNNIFLIYYIYPNDQNNILLTKTIFADLKCPKDFFFTVIGNYVPFLIIFSTSIFFIGLIGIIIKKKSIIELMMCIELMFLGISLNFIIFSFIFSKFEGQLYALFIITIAAAESAIGLGLLMNAHKLKKNNEFKAFILLKG